MKRKPFLLMCALVLIVSLVSSPIITCAEAAKEKVKLVYWTWLSNEDMVAEYNKNHPDVEIIHTKMGSYDSFNKFTVALAAGTGAPDIMQSTIRHFPPFAASEQLVALDDKIADIKDGFTPQALANGSYNGQIYGLQADISPAVIWYRRDIFEKCGVEPKFETWDDFMAAAEVFKANGISIMPLFNPAGSWGSNALTMYLHSRGGNYYTEDGKLITDNAEVEYVLSWLDNLNRGGYAQGIRFFTPEFWGALKEGKYACWPMNIAEGANIRNNMPEQEGLWGCMPFPKWSDKEEDLTGIWGGTILTTPKQSQHSEQAIEFIKWVCGTVEGQVWAGKTWGAVPAYQPAYEDEFFQQGNAFFGGDNPYTMIKPQAEFYYYDWSATERELGLQLDMMFAQKITAQEARQYIETYIAQNIGR